MSAGTRHATGGLGQPRPLAGEAPGFAHVPAAPGVYVFFDAAGRPLYVGKSKCLRTRLRAHFSRGAAERRKRSALRQSAASFAFEETESHFAALLREVDLVQRLAPPMNQQYRFAERYAYLAVDFRHPFPRLGIAHELCHGPVYLGPVPAPRRLASALQDVADLFGLRTCGDPLPGVEEGRKCWRFQVATCLAPCVGTVSAGVYGRRLLQALQVLTGPRQPAQRWQQSLRERALANPQSRDRLERRLASVEKVRRMLLFARFPGDDAVVVQPRMRSGGAELWVVRRGEVVLHESVEAENWTRAVPRLWVAFANGQERLKFVEKNEHDRRWLIYRFLRSEEGRQWSVPVGGRAQRDVEEELARLVRAAAAKSVARLPALLPQAERIARNGTAPAQAERRQE